MDDLPYTKVNQNTIFNTASINFTSIPQLVIKTKERGHISKFM